MTLSKKMSTARNRGKHYTSLYHMPVPFCTVLAACLSVGTLPPVSGLELPHWQEEGSAFNKF